MKNTTTKNITDILQNSSLARIVQRADILHLLNLKIQQNLPSFYRGLYRITNLVDNQMTFEVQSAVVAQGLQLQQASLLPLIQADFPEVTVLKFKINPNFKPL